MSLLNQLWDDTVAGPPPENGLGKLRKFSTFNFRPNSGKGTPLLLSRVAGGSAMNLNLIRAILILILYIRL